MRVAKTSDVRLGDLDDPYALEEPDDLQVPGDQPFLDVRQARLAVGGVHGLELAADAWNHDVALAGTVGDQLDDLGMEEWHVAGDRQRGPAPGGLETGVDATERAVIRINICDHREPEKRVEIGSIGHDQHVVDRRSERGDDALDDRLSAQLDQRLGAPTHPYASAAGLDHSGHFHRELALDVLIEPPRGSRSRTATAP